MTEKPENPPALPHLTKCTGCGQVFTGTHECSNPGNWIWTSPSFEEETLFRLREVHAMLRAREVKGGPGS